MSRYDRHARELTHFIKQDPPIPEAINLILGDAIHNLRSALDHCVWSMVGDLADEKVRGKIQFPFVAEESRLVRSINDRSLELAGEKVVAEIHRCEPYPGGNELLYGLYTLDVADKHKLIITSYSVASMNSLDFARMVPGLKGYANVDISIHHGAKFVVTGVKPGQIDGAATQRIARITEYERKLQPTFEIAFGEGEALSGRAVIPTLMAIAQEVEDTIRALCDAYAAREA
jgi:hypothetical protein